MVDANEYWSPKQAIRRVRAFEDHYDLTWVEEPARRWDYRGLRKVSQSVRAAVATGENLDDISQFTPLISNGAVDVVQIGAGTSGITGAIQVADLAYAFDLPVSMMNCPGNFMAHVAAALPNHVMMEVIDAGRDAVMCVDSAIDGGWIVLGDSPGLGMSFDAAKLARAAVEVPSRDAGPSPWGRRPGAGLLEVPPTVEEMPGEE
jgi:L-alanine-DL-glutamate epimerase-like enolase superfamily enzyme